MLPLSHSGCLLTLRDHFQPQATGLPRFVVKLRSAGLKPLNHPAGQHRASDEVRLLPGSRCSRSSGQRHTHADGSPQVYRLCPGEAEVIAATGNPLPRPAEIASARTWRHVWPASRPATHQYARELCPGEDAARESIVDVSLDTCRELHHDRQNRTAFDCKGAASAWCTALYSPCRTGNVISVAFVCDSGVAPTGCGVTSG